jgi:hypothetical protein
MDGNGREEGTRKHNMLRYDPITVALLSLLLSLCGCFQIPTLDSVVLRPSLEIEKTPLDHGFEFEAIELPVAEGRSINVWLVPSVESKALVLIIPGSDSNKSRYAEGLPLLVPEGFDVLLMDYEGFGDSPGPPSLAACMDDGFVATDFAMTLHENVFLLGASLGTPIVANVAAQREVTGCLFEATADLYHIAAFWGLKYLPIPDANLWHLANLYIIPQVPASYRITQTIMEVEEPKLFMHSPEDEVAPFDNARVVYFFAEEPKEFWETQGPHGLMVRLEPELYGDRITGFMDSVLEDAE